MALNEILIKGIEEIVQVIKTENNIKNEIIRDDVFSILQASECTVLYYPLDGEENDGCDGCHIEKPVNGRMEQFVFINTNNTRERQAFSAAHELGHIWKVDERLQAKFPQEYFDEEEAVNKFAAELLMPKQLFEEAIEIKLKLMNYSGPKMKNVEMVKLIAYLMNYFFVPFKSVVLRFNELNRLNDKYNDDILIFKDSELLKEIIKAEQYTRLGIVNKLCSMDNLNEYLIKAEKKRVFNETKINNIRKEFDIKQVEESSSDDVVFGRGI